MTAIDNLDAHTGPARVEPVGRSRASRWRIGVWLIASAGMVFAMAVIGAITRLTESGLSMVEWRPLIGAVPPLSEAEWNRVFALYRETPEYQLKNAGMTLAEFQTIFFWEWLHRLWGRLIGLVYALPMVAFWVAGDVARITHVPRLRVKLVGLLFLGGLQGVIGWYMVQSGLIDRPSVSHYRLALHLGLATVIFALLIWLAMDVFSHRRAPEVGHGPAAGTLTAGWFAVAAIGVTMLWGAFVAGLDAGIGWNTWPMMGDRWLQPMAWALSPAWVNLFETPTMVQFVHRWLAIAAAVVVLGYALMLARSGNRPLALLVAGAVTAQVALGIATLLTFVAIPLAAAHQAGALFLLATLLFAQHWVALNRPLFRNLTIPA